MSNADLARAGSLDAIRAHPPLARFLAFVAAKPPDFTRRHAAAAYEAAFGRPAPYVATICPGHSSARQKP
ncbi:hypothetical protein AB5I41_12690 [Sphingomonas sp. MMS24-JH45]